MKKDFFSLIELIIIVAIIALLAAIMFPAFSSARQKTKKTACLNNLRQIGQGLEMYFPENNFFFPHCTMTPSNPPAGEENLPSIKEVISHHVKDPDVFLCPSDPDKKYFLQEGLSYEWQSSAINGRKVDEKSLILLGYNRFIMMDYDNFHGSDKNYRGKNYLYLNARAEGDLKVD